MFTQKYAIIDNTTKLINFSTHSESIMIPNKVSTVLEIIVALLIHTTFRTKK